MNSRNTFDRFKSVFILAVVLWGAAWPVSAEDRANSESPPKSFATPEDAANALVTAVESKDSSAPISGIFGAKHVDILSSGDEVEDQASRDSFLVLAKEKVAVEKTDDNRALLHFGEKDWVFPIPLVKKDEQWQFDPEAGFIEMVDRRIGRNELSTIGVLQSYVEAQFDYASVDRDGDEVAEYAQKILSDPGKMDGLYWETQAGEPQSPFGLLIAQARAEGYKAKKSADERTPYHGYFYKILTSQGPKAPGGQYDYIINGNMIAGFAMVAFPAKYGASGVMTFIVNHQGKIYQKDLGPQTEKLALAMKRYDPDNSWELVDTKTLP